MRFPWFKEVDKLVALSVLSSVGITWLLLTGLDAFTTFATTLSTAGQSQSALSTASLQVLFTLPRRAYEWFGNAAMIGSLLGLGALAATSELTALRAAGLSKLRICASVILTLVILTVLIMLIGETLGAYGEQQAQALSLSSKSKDVALAKGGRVWARDGDTFISARRGQSNQITENSTLELNDVRIFEFTPKGQLSTLSLAKSATHSQGQWTLYDLRRTKFEGSTAISTEEKIAHWVSGLDPQVLALSIIRPQYLSIRDLERNIEYLQRNRQDASSFQQAYWTRLFYPFNVLVLTFCVLPFAFGTLRSGGFGKRLFLGMVLAVSFYFVQRSIVNMAVVYDFNFALANAAPGLLLIVAGVIYFRRHA